MYFLIEACQTYREALLRVPVERDLRGEWRGVVRGGRGGGGGGGKEGRKEGGVGAEETSNNTITSGGKKKNNNNNKYIYRLFYFLYIYAEFLSILLRGNSPESLTYYFSFIQSFNHCDPQLTAALQLPDSATLNLCRQCGAPLSVCVLTDMFVFANMDVLEHVVERDDKNV